ncbi:hypothetical protein [Catonella morbi]|nr:hypothetical protein [Catonella morbi]
MSKVYLFVLSLMQLLMGILGAVTLIRSVMENNYSANLLFTVILTLFGFYFGINGFRRLLGKAEGDGNDENGQEKCSGG